MDMFREIAGELPRLRRYARALTRDRHSADDLVQDCLSRALVKSHLWHAGTDLRAWLFAILHNQHVNQVRKATREGVALAQGGARPGAAAPVQGIRLELRDLDRALARLPEEQREVLILVGLEGMRYERVAEIMEVPIGTIRSRLSRGRTALRLLMDDAEEPSAPCRLPPQPAARRCRGQTASISARMDSGSGSRTISS